MSAPRSEPGQRQDSRGGGSPLEQVLGTPLPRMGPPQAHPLSHPPLVPVGLKECLPAVSALHRSIREASGGSAGLHVGGLLSCGHSVLCSEPYLTRVGQETAQSAALCCSSLLAPAGAVV